MFTYSTCLLTHSNNIEQENMKFYLHFDSSKVAPTSGSCLKKNKKIDDFLMTNAFESNLC